MSIPTNTHPVMRFARLLAPVLALALVANATNAAIVTTNFDSLATGAVTAANLNSVTTGGSWTLSSDSNLTHSIVDDGGDKALLSDYANIGAGKLEGTGDLRIGDSVPAHEHDFRVSFFFGLRHVPVQYS